MDDRVRGLSGGADDYLVKPFSFDELNARLISLVWRAAKSSSDAVVPTVLTAGNLRLNRLARRVWRDAQPVELQPC